MPEYPIQQLADDLARALTPEDFHRAFRESCDVFDQTNTRIIAEQNIELECHEGCSLCCTLRVDVFAHEVLIIADHILARFSPERISEILERLDAHADRVLPLTPFQHATRNVVCPLLKDGRCSVYEVRPLSCRRHHSLDYGACQFTYDHPADLEFPGAHHRPLFRALSEAMQRVGQVYLEQGFDMTIYELGTALVEALSSDECRERWHEGSPAFVHASVTPSA
jgi:Fe-S-cluster containining protein